MRILFLNSLRKNRWGGGEKWMVEAAAGLIDKGHECSIACLRNSVIENKALEKKIPTIKFSIKSDFDSIAFFQLKKILEKEKIEVLVCCQNKDVKVGGFAARRTGIKAIFSRQGLQLFKSKRRYKYPFTKLIDGIITNTQSIKDIYESFGWFRPGFIHVVHNGIQIPDSNLSLKKETVFGVNPTDKVVFSAGRLSEQKGFKHLIEAAKLCKENDLTYKFFIAGTGKLENELKQQVNAYGLKDKITFLGFIKNLTPYYRAADVFVLPSLYEGMPNVVMESMANGTPAIATRVNGSAELIEDSITGYLVEPESPLQIMEALEKYFQLTHPKQQMGLAALNHVKTNFSVERMCEQLEEIFKHQLSKA